VYELTKGVSGLKVLALVLNLAVVAYLLFAKRLFGLRGGGKAEQAEYDADVGWPAIERATPGAAPEPERATPGAAPEPERATPGAAPEPERATPGAAPEPL
jgi:hypothetical protein